MTMLALNWVAVEVFKKDRKMQDFSGHTRIDLGGAKWVRLRSLSIEAVAGGFQRRRYSW